MSANKGAASPSRARFAAGRTIGRPNVALVKLTVVVLALLVSTLGAAGTESLASFAAAVSSLQGYTTSIHLFEKRGSETENAVYRYAYTKPSDVTMQIVSGPNAGASVAWNGGASVSAGKGSGFAGMFRKSVPLADPLVTSLRGYTVSDLSFPSILKHAQTTAGTLSATQAALGGVRTDILTLEVADPARDNDMTREVLYLDASTHLPRRIDGFVGTTLVRSYSFDSTATK